VPTIRREEVLAAAPEAVWAVVAEPSRLAQWWPGVTRVEEASPQAWTTVMTSPRGKTLRSDFTLLEAEPPRRLVWRHEVEESPFERIMSDSRVQVLLEPDGEGTRVELAQRIRLRGFARFGVLQVRRATARTLRGALEGLGRLVGES
jgi:uncharacterized protein YndB with AHSA1/START domain